MPNEVVTLESIAEQLAGIRDEQAAFRVDVLEHFGRGVRSFVRIESECYTIKAAIGRLESRVEGRANAELAADLAELKSRLERLEAQLDRGA